jgi:hypothetical protein
MSDAIDSTLENLRSLFQSTDKVLSEWTGEGNLQLPALILMMAASLNWSDEQMRQVDPIVRYYIRNHSDWHVTRGSGGGIMRASEKQKKEALKVAKEAARKKVEAALAAKEASRLTEQV